MQYLNHTQLALGEISKLDLLNGHSFSGSQIKRLVDRSKSPLAQRITQHLFPMYKPLYAHLEAQDHTGETYIVLQLRDLNGLLPPQPLHPAILPRCANCCCWIPLRLAITTAVRVPTSCWPATTPTVCRLTAIRRGGRIGDHGGGRCGRTRLLGRGSEDGGRRSNTLAGEGSHPQHGALFSRAVDKVFETTFVVPRGFLPSPGLLVCQGCV